MKTWLILGAIFVILGLLTFVVIMSINHWDFSKLSTAKYVTNAYTVKDPFTDISVITNTANIDFVPSDTNDCQVVCYEAENQVHSVSVEDGCLTVRVKDNRKWYEYIGINFGVPKVTVTLPRGAYESLVVKGSTGNVNVPGDFSFADIDITVSTGSIRAEDLSAGDVNLRVTTGRVTVSQLSCTGILSIQTSTGKANLTDVSCDTLTSTGDTGHITLENVIAGRYLSIVRSTGDVKLVKCDAAELTIKTDTGNITGSLLSSKVFIAHTDTGRVNVPRTATGGRCEVTTDTGNIKFEIVSA